MTARTVQLFVSVRESEWKALKAMAEKEKISISNLLRQGLNSLALDVGDDACLEETEPSTRWTKFNPAVQQKAITMQAEGYSYRQIARHLGCSSSQVAKWIRGKVHEDV
jgi:DNA invertase Pin-like site-specific DNA recombinase